MWEKKGTLEILAKHLGLLKNKGTGASVTVNNQNIVRQTIEVVFVNAPGAGNRRGIWG
ncbi:MAG: hypothetical protein HY787_04180 [Deltaproteobacteria bacterium]|nr:hypothetical protein [Deltaproteobacteria bacterium]